MTRRECFERVGGLSVAFPRNYNDVDFCLKLGAAGYRIVLNPRAQLLHYESSSRGFLPVEPEELELLQNRWGTRLLRDPYYNPNFLPGADFVTLVDPLGRTPAEAGLV
jgi:GT2 family glycosyltransferase